MRRSIIQLFVRRIATNANHFSFLVIGAGSGGIAAARRAAQYGANVALIERARLGGTCVNVGCVPKKVMFNAATIAEHVHKDGGNYGFTTRSEFSWQQLRENRNAYVASLNKIYDSNLSTSGITTIRGTAKFVDSNTVEVNGKTRYTADHVLIATGSRPMVPDPPGSELGITSDDFFNTLSHLPRNAAVVGGGYIAVELSSMLNALGTSTTLVMRGQSPLKSFDQFIGVNLRNELANAGIAVVTNTSVHSVKGDSPNGPLELTTSDGRRLGGFDCLIWAVGRQPNTAGLGLDAAKVAVTSHGAIIVDESTHATSAPNTYAVGDVTTSRWQLTPTAIADGRHLAERLFNPTGAAAAQPMAYDIVPTVIFSHPPAGSVGMTQAEAESKYGAQNVTVYTTRFVNIFYSVKSQSEQKDKARTPPWTYMKLIVTGTDEKVVGVHVVGLGADEMLQGFAVAMTAGATKRHFDRTVAIHPTAAEEMVLMRTPLPK